MADSGRRLEQSTGVERVYSTIDKSDWGPGEWQDEPDKIQFRDGETGFACLVKRSGGSGAWCGYVGVPEGHPAYEQDYGDVRVATEDGWPDVHGGLTYSNFCAEGPEDSSICHVPEPGEPDNVWWLGFDCSHGGDIAPARAAREREMAAKKLTETGSAYPWDSLSSAYPETYRNLAYAREEVIRLAAQLALATTATTEGVAS